jgi:hypothetical protein
MEEFRQVAEFPSNKERLVRATRNPMDKCTIVSIFPRDILDEIKHTIYPGKFEIPAGTYEHPSLLVVGSSSWWNKFDSEKPAIEIVNSSIQVAESVIKDYCNGILGCNMEDSMPGLFFVLGEHNVLDIKTKYKTKLDETKAKQDNWYKVLVRLADSLWARGNGNPLVIWDMMRLAAKSLNFNDKPWLKDFKTVELIKCKACGGLKDPEYPVCPSCKSIDTAHPLAKELKFAV